MMSNKKNDKSQNNKYSAKPKNSPSNIVELLKNSQLKNSDTSNKEIVKFDDNKNDESSGQENFGSMEIVKFEEGNKTSDDNKEIAKIDDKEIEEFKTSDGKTESNNQSLVKSEDTNEESTYGGGTVKQWVDTGIEGGKVVEGIVKSGAIFYKAKKEHDTAVLNKEMQIEIKKEETNKVKEETKKIVVQHRSEIIKIKENHKNSMESKEKEHKNLLEIKEKDLDSKKLELATKNKELDDKYDIEIQKLVENELILAGEIETALYYGDMKDYERKMAESK